MTGDDRSFNRAHTWAFRVLTAVVFAVPTIPYGWFWHGTLIPLYTILALLAMWLGLITYAERTEGRSVDRQGQVLLTKSVEIPLDREYRNEWDDPYEIETDDWEEQ